MNYIELELFERKIIFYDENHYILKIVQKLIKINNYKYTKKTLLLMLDKKIIQLNVYKNKKDDWRPVKITLRKDNYKTITLTKYGFQYHILVHRLVFYAHNPLWDFYYASTDNSIDHMDGNRQNNSITNLQCISNQENCFNRRKL